jgi:predicted transcriptional regulator
MKRVMQQQIAVDRRLQAWELRKTGKSEAAIAEVIGVTQQAVSLMLIKVANDLTALTLESVEQQRQLDLTLLAE